MFTQSWSYLSFLSFPLLSYRVFMKSMWYQQNEWYELEYFFAFKYEEFETYKNNKLSFTHHTTPTIINSWSIFFQILIYFSYSSIILKQTQTLYHFIHKHFSVHL